jgi:hypothetical protein
MAKDDPGLGSCVVVVGDPGGELVQTTVRLAREREMDATPCDNAYAAVAQMAKAAGRRILVVGPIAELARENGAFFRIAAAHAVRCCCLLGKSGPDGRENLLAALRAGAAILGDAQDVRGVLKEWLRTAPSRGSPHVEQQALPARRRAQDAADASFEDLRATEAELSALLG